MKCRKHDRHLDSRKRRNFSQLLIKLFSNTKTRWAGSSNFQFEKIEQFPKSLEFSVIQSFPHTVFRPEQGLKVQLR